MKTYNANTDPETDTMPVTVVRETDKAFLFRCETGKEAFFPKSEITFSRRNVKTGEALAEIPLWLLEAKGW